MVLAEFNWSDLGRLHGQRALTTANVYDLSESRGPTGPVSIAGSDKCLIVVGLNFISNKNDKSMPFHLVDGCTNRLCGQLFGGQRGQDDQ